MLLLYSTCWKMLNKTDKKRSNIVFTFSRWHHFTSFLYIHSSLVLQWEVVLLLILHYLWRVDKVFCIVWVTENLPSLYLCRPYCVQDMMLSLQYLWRVYIVFRNVGMTEHFPSLYLCRHWCLSMYRSRVWCCFCINCEGLTKPFAMFEWLNTCHNYACAGINICACMCPGCDGQHGWWPGQSELRVWPGREDSPQHLRRGKETHRAAGHRTHQWLGMTPFVF